MQIDNPPVQCRLSERAIWNWMENVNMYLCTINRKEIEANASIDRVLSTQPDAPPFPTTININGIDYNAFTIEVIKRYNGGRYFGYNAATNQWEVVNEGPNAGCVENVLNTTCQ